MQTREDTLSPEKERQIVVGAAAVFAADGYEGASMSRIALEAGVSKGTLYNYFAGKAELFSAVVRRECDQSLLVVFDDLDESAPADVTLRRIGERMLRMLVSEPVLAIYRMVLAEAGHFPELAHAFWAAGPARVQARMAAWIRENGAAAGLAIPDPEFAAEQLFALMQTKVALRRRLRLITTVDDAEISQVVECAVRLFLRGYAAA